MAYTDVENDYIKHQEDIKKLAGIVSDIAAYHGKYTGYSLLEMQGKSNIHCSDKEWQEVRSKLEKSLGKASKILEELVKQYPGHFEMHSTYKEEEKPLVNV